MKSKEYLIEDFKKNKKYRSCFLLAWSKFLTYKEIEETNNFEAFDAEVNRVGSGIKTINDWNKNVIPYTEDNLKKALCIAMSKAFNDILLYDGYMSKIYVHDIKSWLFILDNKEFSINEYSKENIIKFYNNVAKFYKIDIPEKLIV